MSVGFVVVSKNYADPVLSVALGIAVAFALLCAIIAAWLFIRKRTNKFTDAGQRYAAVQRADMTPATSIPEATSFVAASDTMVTDTASAATDTSLAGAGLDSLPTDTSSALTDTTPTFTDTGPTAEDLVATVLDNGHYSEL